MICQKVKNFNLGSLNKTKVTASSGLILIMAFAQEIGLAAELEKRFSHLKKRQRGYSVSEKILSFVEMLIKGGRRLSDIDILSSDPGLLDMLGMDRFPQANTLGDLARRFTRREINSLAEIVMKLSSKTIRKQGLKEIIVDIDSSLIDSEVGIAEKSYEGLRGFNPLMGIIKGQNLSMAGFSLFRPGNAAPVANNLSLLRKISGYFKKNNPEVKVNVRMDSAGYNHKIMLYCDQAGHGFVIAGDRYGILLDTIAAIAEEEWEKLMPRKKPEPAAAEEVAEGIHFVGPEKRGKAYRFVVVRHKRDQLALFPEYEYSYRIYFTNTDWDKHKVVHFYRQRGDAENVIKEEKEGFAIENIMSGDFLANAALFQMQLLAYNLVQYFKYTNLKRSWWNLRIKQLRFRLINIAGVVVNHARKTILRISLNYKYMKTFYEIYHLLAVKRVELLI
ncbi:MAG: IS1380 family transposase [Candidatus Aminicenantes bacterium]|nr:IS1380 family transposase [Candidatus Aminicenantes bacterium]